MSENVGPEVTMAVVRELAEALTRWRREPGAFDGVTQFAVSSVRAIPIPNRQEQADA